MKWWLVLSGLLLLAGCHTAVVSKEATLKVEAAIVFSYGGPQPVAREQFYLSSKNLPDILVAHGSKPGQFEGTYALAQAGWSHEAKAKVEAVNAAIEKDSLPALMTDFSGKLTTSAPPGQYYLIGIASLRGNIVLWSVPLTLVAGQTTNLILDQHNALPRQN